MSENPIDSVIIPLSAIEALDGESSDVFKESILALMQYGCKGIEPNLSGVPRVVFRLTKPYIDSNNEKLLKSREQRSDAAKERWKNTGKRYRIRKMRPHTTV